MLVVRPPRGGEVSTAAAETISSGVRSVGQVSPFVHGIVGVGDVLIFWWTPGGGVGWHVGQREGHCEVKVVLVL